VHVKEVADVNVLGTKWIDSSSITWPTLIICVHLKEVKERIYDTCNYFYGHVFVVLNVRVRPIYD
jgi:hypothetical protein